MTTTNNTPFVVRDGQVSVAVFNNDGRYNISVRKQYRDKSGTWKDTNYYTQRDLSTLLSLIKTANAYMADPNNAKWQPAAPEAPNFDEMEEASAF